MFLAYTNSYCDQAYNLYVSFNADKTKREFDIIFLILNKKLTDSLRHKKIGVTY